MDLKPISTSPFVYTTRLEEMRIFRKDLNKMSSKKVIKNILSESKPCYSRNTILKGSGTINKGGGRNNYNHDKSFYKYHHGKRVLKSRLSYEELQSKLNEICNKINRDDKVTVKDEIETPNGASENLLKLLAMCKPLKVVLQDCNLIVHKEKYVETNGDKMHILNSSSNTNDDVLIKHDSKESQLTSNKNKPLSRNIKKPIVTFTSKTVNDLKNILCTLTLNDCAIVIYNVYLKKIDAYHIDKYFRVTECRTWNYVEVTEIPMKVCQTVYNIIACCWRNRESYVSVLMDSIPTNCKNICKVVITREHLCSPCCTCCCTIKTTPKANVNIANEEESNCATRKKTKLIDIALRHRYRSRYKKYPEWKKNMTCNNDKMGNKYYKWMNLLQLNHTNGNAEFYEMDKNHIVYSKLIINNDQKLTWTASTMGLTRSHSKFKYTDPQNREEKIITYCKQKYVPFNTMCFFRRPMELSAQLKNKKMPHAFRSPLFIDNIKHTTSLVGTGEISSVFQENRSTKNKVPIATQKKEKVKPAVKLQPVLLTGTNTQSQLELSQIQSVPLIKQKQIPATEETLGMSETINSMIKDILHRFRNVLLTINPHGKVSAALNAPLSTLNSSELHILGQILYHAQIQVDKLGLTPGTCLNANGFTVIQSNVSNVDMSSTEDNNFNNNTEMAVSADITQIKNEETKSAYLEYFTKIICHKKMYYEKSFYSFINDTVQSTPKISNVFSLNKTDCNSADNSHVLGTVSDIIYNVEDTFSVKSETITDPNLLMDMCINECKEDLTLLENEIDVTPSRKRKSLLNSKTELPKTRVKRSEDVVGDGMGRKVLVRPNILQRSEPSTSALKSVPNIGLNCSLRDLLLSKPKKMQLTPVPSLVMPQITKVTTLHDVSAHGEIIAHTNLPKVPYVQENRKI